VYLDKSLPSEVRYLAIIQLKNGIDKYWRKSAVNAISADDKAGIRSRVLEGGIAEEESQLALQNALVVSKIVRVDYPFEWTEALTDLIKIVRTASGSNPLHLRRALLMLHQVIKELSTARLRRSQTSLQSVTPEIVSLLNTIYSDKVSQWLGLVVQGNGGVQGDAIYAMENSLFTIKILRRLLISGYEYPSHDKDVQQLWQSSQAQFGQFLNMLNQDPPILVSPAKELVEKHLVQFSKLHVEMCRLHPAAFALLPSSLELVRSYWGLVSKFGESYGSVTQDFSAQALNIHKDKLEKPAMEKICLKGLVLLRSCIQMVYHPVSTFKFRNEEAKKEQKEAVQLIKSQLLTDDFVGQLASIIVTKFFVFRQADLEAWEEDEDEWEIREEGM